MKKQPIVISKVEIKEVIDLGFTVSQKKPRIPQYRRGQLKRNGDRKSRRSLTEHRSKPHAVITSQSPKHC